jgi:hypothetical protein
MTTEDEFIKNKLGLIGEGNRCAEAVRCMEQTFTMPEGALKCKSICHPEAKSTSVAKVYSSKTRLTLR